MVFEQTETSFRALLRDQGSFGLVEQTLLTTLLSPTPTRPLIRTSSSGFLQAIAGKRL